MGNNHSFNNAVARQEQYVQREKSKINQSSNYVGYNHGKHYSDSQIEGKLRQEYHGTISYGNRNDYVLSSDWDRMRHSYR